MSDTNLFERIVTPEDVEGAMRATIAEWAPDYFAELERNAGYAPGEVARPAGVITTREFAKWPEDQLPLILVMSGGTIGKPVRRARGTYEAAWAVTVAAIVSDVDQGESRRLMAVYAGAIRAMVLQHKMLKSSLHEDGFATFLAWEGETYSDIDFVDSRNLDSCRVNFSVGVEQVVTEQAGPREPSEDPLEDPGEWPGVSEVDINVEAEALTA